MDSHYQPRKKKSDKAKDKYEKYGGFSSKRIRQLETALENHKTKITEASK